jgi:hypothetical protein
VTRKENPARRIPIILKLKESNFSIVFVINEVMTSKALKNPNP